MNFVNIFHKIFHLKKDEIKNPIHIGIIMDGNTRWAKKRSLPSILGHIKGARIAMELAKISAKNNIGILTLFAFSVENWYRKQCNAQKIINIVIYHLEYEIEYFQAHNIQIRFIGDLSKLNKEQRVRAERLVAQTKESTGLKLIIAISYSGRWDIMQAVNALKIELSESSITNMHITEQQFSKHLSLSDLPDPDLVIRTGGEVRISNFLLWQMAYAELYFTDILWPDFTEEDFHHAISIYQKRNRRFGK